MSIRVAKGNLDLNDAAGRITLDVGSADWAGGRTYDVVVANIIARVLISIADDLKAATTQGGMLLLSGIIEPKEAETRERFDALGFELLERNQIEDWISLAYHLPG